MTSVRVFPALLLLAALVAAYEPPAILAQSSVPVAGSPEGPMPEPTAALPPATSVPTPTVSPTPTPRVECPVLNPPKVDPWEQTEDNYVFQYCIANPNFSDTANMENYRLWGVDEAPGYGMDASVLKAFLRNMALSPDNSKYCYLCGRQRVTGCFPPGTKITLADGSTKNIEDMMAGDQVWNPIAKRAVSVRQIIEGPEEIPLIRYGAGEQRAVVTQLHPMLTKAGIKKATELTLGDMLVTADGTPVEITLLEKLPVEEGQRVINLLLNVDSLDKNERMLIADGFVTGDWHLQTLGEQESEMK